MSRGGAGFGSASAALVFAVLCLTIFTLITFTSAKNDKALADAEASLVTGYYEADTLAEYILAELLGTDTAPDSIRGVEITSHRDTGEVEFSCRISDRKELYVKVALRESSYDILCWRMRDTGEWDAEEGLPVWPGI